MTTIELTRNQAIAFRLLAQAGAWDVKGGSITIHFDPSGIPCKIEKRELYTMQLSTAPDFDNTEVVRA